MLAQLIQLIKDGKETEVIDLLQSKYFNLNFTDVHQKNVLMYTCEYKHQHLLQFLIEKYNQDDRLNLNLLDSQNQTALYYACLNEDAYTIDKLVENGIDVDSLNINLETALNFSASKNLTLSVDTLLKHSKNLSDSDWQRRTPLIWACKIHNKDMMLKFLEAGLDPNKIEQNGMTCLYHATQYNDNDMINTLIKFGANLEIVNDIDKTVLHYVAQFNRISVVENLIEKNANLNPLDNRGKTPLMYACEAKHMDLAHILIRHGAKFSFLNNYDRTGFSNILNNISSFNFLLFHTSDNDTLIQYQNIIEDLKGEYKEQIRLIENVLLNQSLKKKLLRLYKEYTKRIKI